MHVPEPTEFNTQGKRGLTGKMGPDLQRVFTFKTIMLRRRSASYTFLQLLCIPALVLLLFLLLVQELFVQVVKLHTLGHGFCPHLFKKKKNSVSLQQQ